LLYTVEDKVSNFNIKKLTYYKSVSYLAPPIEEQVFQYYDIRISGLSKVTFSIKKAIYSCLLWDIPKQKSKILFPGLGWFRNCILDREVLNY